MKKTNLKVAIVHDWLIGGGAEKVVQELHNMYPDAPIYTSYCTPEWRQKLAPAPIITGYLQHWPFSRLRKYLPLLRQRWFSNLDLSQFDVVLSSSGAEAKGVNVGKNAVHINYCHAPTHYYWLRYDEYLKNPGFGIFDPLARLGLKLLIGPLRQWDYGAAQKPDVMVANSTYIKDMIKKYYARDALVVHPPVAVDRFASKSKLPRRGFVTAGRQTPYKRIDLAVQACTKLNLPLIVIGNGPDHQKLKTMAGPSITFLDKVSDGEMPLLFQTAQAFIFPNVDDFGITPVEAMAAGTPVIAYKGGGALDYVTPGKTGELFEPQTVDALAAAIKKFKPGKYNAHSIARSAGNFSPEHFRSNMAKIIAKHGVKK